MGKILSMKRRGSNDLDITAGFLVQGIDLEFVNQLDRGTPERPVVLLIFDQYKYWNKENVGMVVMLVQCDGYQTADVALVGITEFLMGESLLEERLREKAAGALHALGFREEEEKKEGSSGTA